MGTVTIQETPYRDLNLNQWKKFCIVQCNHRVRSPNPSPSPLVEISLNRVAIIVGYIRILMDCDKNIWSLKGDPPKEGYTVDEMAVIIIKP